MQFTIMAWVTFMRPSMGVPWSLPRIHGEGRNASQDLEFQVFSLDSPKLVCGIATSVYVTESSSPCGFRKLERSSWR